MAGMSDVPELDRLIAEHETFRRNMEWMRSDMHSYFGFRLMLAAAVIAAALWSSEPRGQEYAVRHGDAVLFWITDERQPAYGEVCYMWGYVPAIVSGGRTFRFCDVEWCYGGL
jgi:hypothetical protein